MSARQTSIPEKETTMPDTVKAQLEQILAETLVGVIHDLGRRKECGEPCPTRETDIARLILDRSVMRSAPILALNPSRARFDDVRDMLHENRDAVEAAYNLAGLVIEALNTIPDPPPAVK